MQLTVQDFMQQIENTEFFFSVRFIKRSDSKERVFRCRTGVKKFLKGGKAAYDFEEKNLVPVWILPVDRRMNDIDNGYRAIPVENIREIRAQGKCWKVEDGGFVEV